MAGFVPIVLAAGASVRMGRPKPLLDFDGQPALSLALEAMNGLPTPIVVLGPNRAAIEARVDLSGARIAMNPDPSSSLTASLRAGLAMLPLDAEGFVFMPVDYPLVRKSDVLRLVAAAAATPTKSVFIPSHEEQHGHPVLCRRAVALEILELPAGAWAKGALKADPSRIQYVPYEDAAVVTDMDTPEDYEQCLRIFRSRKQRNFP